VQLGSRMVAKRLEDLIAWQLARELENQVFAFTANSPACHDFEYCDQIRRSSRSSRRNTAEGFGRFYPKEFVKFLSYAAGSLNETKDHRLEGFDRKYLDAARYEQLRRLCLRAIKANNGLRRYLRGAQPPDASDSI
jgi:four helix bundle protein